MRAAPIGRSGKGAGAGLWKERDEWRERVSYLARYGVIYSS